jgi:predicted  nucleic acid-binding Zn-ribbon protein
MARIEIPIEEYNGMKEKIESLEKSIVEVKKKAELFEHKYNDIQVELENMQEAGFLTRMFGWKRALSKLIEPEE